ncbi:MAG: YdcF family protein [Oscillatoriales cyanobacterium RM1_1_9]|nr:YdcF family protein [Oscillatoriales cyanobacterium SM2_3_0]NJO47240.1 YdcF family protein [Oscillatoriales cyanobacterium RM2_1_1]NJO70913.1 YdcF family protein [Oscillatoriales cyanobacterium RM1_1_9]
MNFLTKTVQQINQKVNQKVRWLSRKYQQYQKFLYASLGIILAFLLAGLLHQVWILRLSAQQPVDLFLVLGGSIKREIYVSELANKFPQTRILISTGSDDPCISQLFRRIQAPLDQVWLEKCADSTFGNFFFTQPLLSRWNVRHVKLITSTNHLPRALWLARIILGAHGIWVEPELVAETGVPGNQESPIKTMVDVTRALVWAGVSQRIQPRCQDVIQLPQVDLKAWCSEGFGCEHQGKINVESLCRQGWTEFGTERKFIPD